MASAAGLGVGSAAGVGAAGGQGTSQAGDAGAAAGLGVGSAAGAGSLPAAAAAVGMGGSKTADWPPPTAAGVAAGQSSRGTTDAGLLEALFPSTLYCITFTLYDGVDVAMRLVSHAKANGFRGKVRHVSTSRSDFTLLLKTDDEASKQTLKRFASWLATEVPVRAPAVATNAAFAKAEEEAVARVVVTSDLSNPLSSDRELLDMYGQGQLTVNAATEVQLALETAAKAVEQMERLSKSSLGKSMASSSHE
ncbi:hypothetical protein HXX76_002349 [Chlamydomonas incerta]|uniref:Uncharacterized protein n=1 Tax=Chlamydomonas incerta TaxID=51695 RepID=A0A835TEJ1_CHLIN|nr:hypothetical protein HXX76_002349 [Chlamydomonas incerta]|eukprot:KAG2442262.1 hypothetical protein HXX76_002349 [Chlamydomonas incerta]